MTGFVLILLPLAGNFRGKVPLSRRLQKTLGFVGFVLLGVGMTLIITLPPEENLTALSGLERAADTSHQIAHPFSEEDLDLLKQRVAGLQQEAIFALDAGHYVEAELATHRAELLLKDALSRSTGNTDILYQSGCLHRNLALVCQHLALEEQREENLALAERSFRLAVSFDSNDPGAWKNLGNVYILRDELDKAEGCMRRAIEIDPGYQAAQDNLAWILAHQ
jgi:tetratricopeptide (TPR) repeat protein